MHRITACTLALLSVTSVAPAVQAERAERAHYVVSDPSGVACSGGRAVPEGCGSQVGQCPWGVTPRVPAEPPRPLAAWIAAAVSPTTSALWFATTGRIQATLT